MTRTFALGFCALLAAAAPGFAGWGFRLPFVQVDVGPGVHVRAPFVAVQVDRGVPIGPPLPPPILLPAPPPPPVPIPVQERPLTLDEFLAAFQPIPGKHEVTLLHTRKGNAVTVCFILPPGCPKVRAHRHEVTFDYGREAVTIRFQLGGRVKVSYH